METYQISSEPIEEPDQVEWVGYSPKAKVEVEAEEALILLLGWNWRGKYCSEEGDCEDGSEELHCCCLLYDLSARAVGRWEWDHQQVVQCTIYIHKPIELLQQDETAGL